MNKCAVKKNSITFEISKNIFCIAVSQFLATLPNKANFKLGSNEMCIFMVLTLSSKAFSSCLSWSLTFDACDLRLTIFGSGLSYWCDGLVSCKIIISSTGINHFNSNVYFSFRPHDWKYVYILVKLLSRK